MWLSIFSSGVSAIMGNGKTILAVVITAWLTFHLTAKVITWNQEQEKEALKSQCEAEKQVTKEANDALVKGYRDINSRAAKYKRMLSSCQTVRIKPESSGAGYAGGVTLEAEWLYDYGARCETYRTERIALEKRCD